MIGVIRIIHTTFIITDEKVKTGTDGLYGLILRAM